MKTLPSRAAVSTPAHERASAIDLLSNRSTLLAALVEAASRRRDVRELRARIVLLLLTLRCPLHGRPARSWYVPGAVTRLGAEGLLRAWGGFYGPGGPCLRSMRSHLGALEQSGILQRSPGDWIPVRADPAHPERRPRFPDTFHVLDGEQATEFWSGPGARLLALHPQARHSPDVWRKLFGHWREGRLQDVFVFGSPEVPTPPRRAAANSDELAEVRARGQELARGLVRARGPLEVLNALEKAGASLKGRASFTGAAQWPRLRSAGGLLARALVRGDRVRSPAGWIVRVLEDATPKELESARAWLGLEPEFSP